MLVVAGVAVGSRFGLTAAAAGVLVAAMADAGLNCWTVCRYTSVAAPDLVRAWAPPLAIAVMLAAAVLAVNSGLAYLQVTRDWHFLLADVVTAALLYPALLFWTPFPSIREIVVESIDDIAPALRRWIPISL